MINKKLIIAHRGACFYEKENTIKSFKKAVELDSDMVEFDVRKTLDNKIIVFHDGKIKGIKNQDLNYSEINKILNCKVETLEKVLKSLKGKIKIDVHLREKGYEKEAIELILKYFNEKDILISSHFLSSLRKIKKYYPKIKTGLVVNVNIKNLFIFPRDKTIDFLIPRRQLLNYLVERLARKYNKKIIPWTINNKKLADKLLKKDVIAGILTDRPDLMKE